MTAVVAILPRNPPPLKPNDGSGPNMDVGLAVVSTARQPLISALA